MGVRWLSVRLARSEELRPGSATWQVYGPPAAGAILFALFGLQPHSALDLAERLVFTTVLLQVIFFDLEHLLILDRMVYPSIALAVLLSLFGSPWWAGVAAGAGLGALFLLLGIAGTALFRQDAMGLGDVKLAVLIGVLLGPLPAAAAIALGFVLAGLVATSIAIWRRSLQGSLPLGPFLATGALVVLYRLA